MKIAWTCKAGGVIIIMTAFLTVFFVNPFAVYALNTQSIDLESGNNQFLSVSDTDQSELDGSDDMTVEAWVKFESLPQPGSDGYDFVSKSISLGNNRSYTFYFSTTNNTLRWVNQSDGFNGADVGVSWVPSIGTWHHVVVSKSGENITFYVDGSQVGATQVGVSAIYDSTAPFRVGAHGNNQSYFDGQIDDVRVWNVARTGAEIAADMNRELTGDEPGLVGYWKLNGSFEDSTANNNDLTPVNGPQFSDDVPFTDEEEGTDPVIVIPGILGSAEKNGVWQIDPIMHTYDDLIATLDANGYTPETDLFTFAYDWRNSNVTTAGLLKQKIDAVKEICECDEVDLVAHSMGGLVARQYVQSGDYDDDVDQIVFLGTPQRGAPKAYLMWEGGEFVTPSVFDGLTQRFLKGEARKNGYTSTFSYLRERPVASVEELLPDYSYLFDNGVERPYPSGYPVNAFLDTLNAGVQSLYGSGTALHAFVGDDDATITGLNVVPAPQRAPLWEHGYPRLFDAPLGGRGLIVGDGDKTVPLSSATFLSATTTALDSSHSALPEDASGGIVALLTGAPASEIVDNWNIPDMKMLLFQLFSPADILVTDPNGRRAGTLNGSEINEIPGAFYAGPEALVEYLTIPNPIPGTYTVLLRGTGSGIYELFSSFLEEGASDDLSRFGSAEPNSLTEYEIIFDETGGTLEPVVTVASMLEHVAFAYKQGWISKGIEASISAKLSMLKTTRNERTRLAIMKSIESEIERRHGSGINDTAYELLSEDIDALMR